jgi:hypothetical protein
MSEIAALLFAKRSQSPFTITICVHPCSFHPGEFRGCGSSVTDAKADDLWVSSPVKNQLYLVQYMDPSVVAATLEELITAPPQNLSISTQYRPERSS